MRRPLLSLLAFLGLGLGLLAVPSSCGSSETPPDSGGKDTEDDESDEDDEGGDDLGKIKLSWDGYDEEGLTAFKIFVAKSKSSDDKALVKEVEVDDDFDTEEPSVTLEISRYEEVEELVGERACFSIVAVTEDGESDASEAACTDLE
jgi:hypothetical protein